MAELEKSELRRRHDVEVRRGITLLTERKQDEMVRTRRS